LGEVAEGIQRSSLGIVLAYGGVFLVVGLEEFNARLHSRALDRPIPPEMRWLLGLPAAIAGAGVALAAVMGIFPVGWASLVAAGGLGAFILAPFAALTLYQIPLFLLWREQPRAAS
jgi:hypothetical protein